MNIKKYLRRDSELQLLFAKLSELTTLNNAVAAYLNPAIAPYCQVTHLAANRLTMLAANGSIATQLRFQTAELLQQFKQDVLLEKITVIQYKVRPFTTPSSMPSSIQFKKMQGLSQPTAKMIHNTAMSLADPSLREVMQRIATRTTPTPVTPAPYPPVTPH